MNEKQLNEIECRALSATPAPWKWDDDAIQEKEYDDKHHAPWLLGAKDCPVLRGQIKCGDNDSDLRFLEAAREDVPALVAEVRRLRAALESVVRCGNGNAVCIAEDALETPNESRSATRSAELGQDSRGATAPSEFAAPHGSANCKRRVRNKAEREEEREE